MKIEFEYESLPPWSNELIPELSGKDKALSWSSAVHRKSSCKPNMHTNCLLFLPLPARRVPAIFWEGGVVRCLEMFNYLPA